MPVNILHKEIFSSEIGPVYKIYMTEHFVFIHFKKVTLNLTFLEFDLFCGLLDAVLPEVKDQYEEFRAMALTKEGTNQA